MIYVMEDIANFVFINHILLSELSNNETLQKN